MGFQLKTDFESRGDQPKAIKKLCSNIRNGVKNQVLLGVTGSGKTYAIAKVIEEIGLPALVISHNKTLTAQLYSEFKSFFPDNAVEYFVSYYDYYQPEAYIKHTDTYIEKDASINERIEKLRLKAASSLLTRKDVIIVASVSCIYGIGEPAQWQKMTVSLNIGSPYKRNKLIEDLIAIQYSRLDSYPECGNFRVRGAVIDIYPAYIENEALRIEIKDDIISRIYSIEPLTANKIKEYENFIISPATHFVIPRLQIKNAISKIKVELADRLKELNAQKKLLEAQRLKMRTEYDIEMLSETGYCYGIENYSRHLSGRKQGVPPACLIDYFSYGGGQFITIIDESHVTIPQIRGMYAGDYSRKTTLVDYGFRLPSALDNRPLKFNEFENIVDSVIYVSATPAAYELEKVNGKIVEQIIRPTGLIDPEVEIRPAHNQIKNLIVEIKKIVKKKQRVLVTTLTKKMAEDLSEFLDEKNIKVMYLHSEIEVLERISILKNLRKGHIDCVVGVNLLREGLDLPEVSLVAILDADKEGFLRSEVSLIQTCGRASRNVNGKVIMYADKITGSMERALKEMSRRRKIQAAFNKKNNITPKSIIKSVRDEKEFEYKSKKEAISIIAKAGWSYGEQNTIKAMEKDMKDAADMLDFELAAIIRDKINEIKTNNKECS